MLHRLENGNWIDLTKVVAVLIPNPEKPLVRIDSEVGQQRDSQIVNVFVNWQQAADYRNELAAKVNEAQQARLDAMRPAKAEAEPEEVVHLATPGRLGTPYCQLTTGTRDDFCLLTTIPKNVTCRRCLADMGERKREEDGR